MKGGLTNYLNVKGMSDAEAASLEANTGMLRDDIRKVADMALVNDVIISFRPVNESTRELMRYHGAAGKPFTMKAKSSDQPIISGFIPFRQEFSKLSSDKNGVNKFNKLVKEELLENETIIKEINSLIEIYNNTETPNAEKENLLKRLMDKTPILQFGKEAFKDKDNNQIYGFIQADGLPLKNNGEVVFAIRKADGHYYDAKNLNNRISLDANCNPIAIEVILCLNVG